MPGALDSPFLAGLIVNFGGGSHTVMDTRRLKSLVEKSEEGNNEQATANKSLLQGCLPGAICFTLHLLLVLAHVVLLISGVKHWEHNFMFPLEHQTWVSFWATVLTQGFGTVEWLCQVVLMTHNPPQIYTSLIVFLTQKIAMQQNLHSYQTLTATHDSFSSWTGLGSGLATLYNQVSLPASVFGTLNVVGYLGCISVLHITIPAILSVETFTTTVPMDAKTLGIPEFTNSTAINIKSTSAFMATYPVQFLPWRGILDDAPVPGLYNSSLHEVLQDTTPGKGTAQVAALGFNITCGYLNASLDWVDLDTTLAHFTLNTTINTTEIEYPTFSSLFWPNSLRAHRQPNNSVVISTTNLVVDSEDSPLNISQIQFFQCSKSLVPQSAKIDAQSNTIYNLSLSPNIHKNHSTWKAAVDTTPQDSTLTGGNLIHTNVEEYLMTTLGLNPYLDVSSSKPVVLQLHDVENALANVVAMTFWAGIHVQPDPWYIKYSASGRKLGTVPVPAAGNTIIQQEITRVRLNVTIGLGTSIALVLLCTAVLWTSKRHDRTAQSDGLLYNIWLWRHHPELSNFTKNVIRPTEANLRATGLIPFQLSQKQGAPHSPCIQQQLPHIMSNSSSTGKIDGSRVWAKHLGIMCILLHIWLVVLSLALVGVNGLWNDTGQTYYTLLVYLTQKIAITHASQKYCALTETHDQVSAWGGIGSAISTLCKQATLPSSFHQIFLISLYLSTISILNVTTPALVSVASFNYVVSTRVETQGIPESFALPDNLTMPSSTIIFLRNNAAFLPWVGNLDEAKKLGLSNGSLYDVMITAYPDSGTAVVSATGFNITCGYIPGIIANKVPQSGDDSFFGDQPYNISFTTQNLSWPHWRTVPGTDVILIANNEDELPLNSIILYTQNPIFDSEGRMGPLMILPDSNVTLQFLQCFRSLVPQIGQVDAGSKTIIPNSLHPMLYKNHSTWKSFNEISQTANNPTSLVEGDYWARIFSRFPDAGNLFTASGDSIDWGSTYLMDQLGLDPSANSGGEVIENSTPGQGLYLHEIENAVSNLVAATFWIGGHVHSSSLVMQDLERVRKIGPIHPPILETSHTTIEQGRSAARLEASIGLGASILLLILAVVLSAGTRTSNSGLNSLGFLQIVWVFEHHPELSEILEQVEDPTDYNLRAAGLFKVRLLDAAEPEKSG
ncbi:hypothetical protein B0H13DRAFT_1897248 [Mycena leptocephala]|nr:hypothetical protein B0H13DRAFT_1897248 [Mycena leptocephala]